MLPGPGRRYLASHPGATVESFYKTTTPSFHDVGVGAILEPYVPKLVNTDGEELVVTVLFDVLRTLTDLFLEGSRPLAGGRR